MEAITIQEAARFMHAQCSDMDETLRISEVCIDTRTITPGCLFWAIRGERFDGHDFIAKAYELGAVGAVSDHPIPGLRNLLVVQDTRQALLDLASGYRDRFRVMLVGVTGSVGKTSTKEMIAAILSAKGKTLKTEGNRNNEIGMPLALLGLDSSHQNAVMEMGMSGPGEIRALSQVCRPAVGVITNIGVSHLENLGSRENILKAKLEITDGMAQDAPLILNADNDLLSGVSGMLEHPVIYYGIDNRRADVTAADIRPKDGGTAFTIQFYGRSIPAWLPLVGRHNVYNALAGFCVGLVENMEPEIIVKAMRLYKNSGLRQNIRQHRGVTIIADCYNASPDSMRSAIDVITNIECTGRRICVFGDMLELGAISEEAHEEIGKAVTRANVDLLACFGEQSRAIRRGALLAGMKNVRHFAEKEELSRWLADTLRPGDAVIFKASRGIALEEVVSQTAQYLDERSMES